VAETLTELLREKLGVGSYPAVNRRLAQAGVAAALVFTNDPNRIGFYLVNLSLNAMYAGPFNNPSSTRGFYIGPNGGSLIVDWREDGHLVGWEWWVIADGAASALLAVELLTKRVP
jgi:hypothetical protein